MLALQSGASKPAIEPVSPYLEMGAYEALWLEKGASFKSIADRFRNDPEALPSDFVPPEKARDCAKRVMERYHAAGIRKFGVRINHAGEYPPRLREARHPVELLYYRGAWELSEKRSVAIVGSRAASDAGKMRAARIARMMAEKSMVVVSGLAEGIDTAAHEATLEAGGPTIAVTGTPLHHVYPKQNHLLQERIARDFLLISQVPALRYDEQDYRRNRLFFPERNVTMSALTEATIIVEAGETSGTLTQARAALHQGRKLLILNSCFEAGLKWPERFLAQGAVRIREPEDIWQALD
ncbi:DNA-processing protein DprA [Henriciella aquimarina]|uniref:DNA-processing protein DprA n=1 Tax=Henriciella aquimarina TaxID=545261 RepID=UPI0009FEC41C|nr:DNA-processing protein DprA [Henriciella aquimarina]